MKVILLEDIKNTGARDTVINVSDGHARNFLFPRKLGVEATPAALQALDERMKNRAAILAKEIAELKNLAAQINGKEVNIPVDVGTSGKLFGSVTSHDIAQQIQKTTGINIDKKKIVLDEPIKTIGLFNVQVKFGHEVSATVKVNVSARPE
jgi:large subunit ribosomal protein L9